MRYNVVGRFKHVTWVVRSLDTPEEAEGYRKNCKAALKRARTKVCGSSRVKQEINFYRATKDDLALQDAAVKRLPFSRAWVICKELSYNTLPVREEFESGQCDALLPRFAYICNSTTNHQGKPHSFAGQDIEVVECFWTPQDGFRATVLRRIAVDQPYPERDLFDFDPYYDFEAARPPSRFRYQRASVPFESLRIR